MKGRKIDVANNLIMLKSKISLLFAIIALLKFKMEEIEEYCDVSGDSTFKGSVALISNCSLVLMKAIFNDLIITKILYFKKLSTLFNAKIEKIKPTRKNNK